MQLLSVILVICACVVACLAQEDYGRRRRPDIHGGGRRCRGGSAGICGGWANSQCPPGSYCRPFYPSATAGNCCRTRPIGGGGGGRCPPPSPMAGICLFDPRRGSCLSDSDCRRGQLCCTEGCGRFCKYPQRPQPVY